MFQIIFNLFSPTASGEARAPYSPTRKKRSSRSLVSLTMRLWVTAARSAARWFPSSAPHPRLCLSGRLKHPLARRPTPPSPTWRLAPASPNACRPSRPAHRDGRCVPFRGARENHLRWPESLLSGPGGQGRFGHCHAAGLISPGRRGFQNAGSSISFSMKHVASAGRPATTARIVRASGEVNIAMIYARSGPRLAPTTRRKA